MCNYFGSLTVVGNLLAGLESSARGLTMLSEVKQRKLFIGTLVYMHIFVVMFEMYMLFVSSDISYHILYFVIYIVGLLSLDGI